MKKILEIAWVLALVTAQSLGCAASGDQGEAGGEFSLPHTAVGPEGATLKFPDGITVEFPPGAVAHTTYVSALTLQVASIQPVLDGNGNMHREAIAGISLEPTGPLRAPVTVTIPLQSELPDHGLPIHYKYDPEYNAYYPARTNVIISPEEGTATLVLTEFSNHVLAFIADILRSDCAEEEPCRCGLFHVEETGSDQIYEQDDCEARSIHGFIEYLDCGPNGVTESWTMLEHTRGCVPKLALAPAEPLLEPGETTSVEARLTYLEDPFPYIEVQLSVNDIVYLDRTNVTTDEAGSAKSTVTAGTHEGVAVVHGEAYILYPTTIIAGNGVEQDVAERGIWLQAETEITVDVPTRLHVSIQPGHEGEHLTYNETTEIDVAVLDFSDSQDPQAFSYVPGVVVDLEVSGGSLASAQVMTSSQGPVTVAYTAPNVSQTVTVIGSAQHDTLTENLSLPVTYDVAAEDSIQVQEQADWLGSMDLSWTGCGLPLPDDDLGERCLGYRYYVTAHFEFTLDVDDGPTASDMNVSGAGSVTVTGAHTVDGPYLDAGSTSLECPTRRSRQYAYDVRTYPFGVSIEGFMEENFDGPNDLWALFRHPSNGGMGPVAWIGERGVSYCGGSPTRTLVSSLHIPVFWNPAIRFDWDPDWGGPEVGFRMDLLGKETATQTGECGSPSSPGGLGTGQRTGCFYYLTMTRVSSQ
jgi:hypothetical protein